MFEKIISLASGKAYNLLKNRGAVCPDCGKPLYLPDRLPSAGFKSMLKCRDCGWMGSISSLAKVLRGDELSEIDEKPSDSNIRETIGEQKASWLIPAKKGLNFLMVFSAFWLAVTSLMGFSMISGGVKMEGGGDQMPFWGMCLFFGIFFLIGLIVGYIGLRMAYTELLVRVDPEKVMLTRKFFRKIWHQSILRQNVGRVYLSESYKKNEQPVYQIEIENEEKNGKNLKFGSNLDDDEKRWLLGSLRGVLDTKKTNKSENLMGSGQVPEEIESKTLKVEQMGRVGFRVTRIYRLGPWLVWIGLIVMCATGAGLVYQWNTFESSAGSGFFFFVDLLFSGIPFLMTLVGFLIGSGMVMGGRWAWGRKKVFEFGRESLTLMTYWKNHRKEKRFDRNEFKQVECSRSGHVNNDPRFKVVLMGENQSVTICDYESSAVVDVVEVWLDQWVGSED